MESLGISNTLAKLRGDDPFKRSGRVERSPPTANRMTSAIEQNTPMTTTTMMNDPAVDAMANCAPQPQEITSVPTGESSSPRLELIYKMRKFEEESIEQCRTILRKMKFAILRQKNVSNDIKDGISELAEQLDVMEQYRKSWKAAEKERKESQLTLQADVREVLVSETPLTSGKRIATSPAENTPVVGKKMREKEPQGWQVVKKKGRKKPSSEYERPVKEGKGKIRKRNRSNRIKAEAVLIKPTEGNSYADVLKNLRTKMQPNEAAKVKGIRKTRTGDLLLEFNRGEKIQTDFVKELKDTIQRAGLVSQLKSMTTLEIRDLDSFTQKEEVGEAVGKLLGSSEDLRIRITTPNSREQIRAFVTLSAENADILLKIGKIRIGWILAKIRPWHSVKRCFRCLGVGHVRMDCKGPDRSGLCLRCGDPGHKISACTGTSKCYLCVDAGREKVDHFSGSGGCPEYKAPRA